MTAELASRRFAAPLPDRLQALADENRLRILDALRGGERCVCELTDRLELGQSLLSHHLRVLRDAGLVLDRKDGRWVHYSLVPEALLDLETFFSELRQEAAVVRPTLRECS
jgi:ArsR family transcriptional regulator